MSSTTYPIIEQHGLEVWADVEYSVEPATGDGWHEPREEARAIIESVTLYQIKTERHCRWFKNADGSMKYSMDPVEVRTELGAAPDWVIRVIENDDGFMSDLVYDALDDDRADYIRDSRIDLELSEGRS